MKILLSLLGLFFATLSFTQPFYNQTPYTCDVPGPYEHDLQEEYVVLDPGDTIEGFWIDAEFYGLNNKVYTFWDSGVKIEEVERLFDLQAPPQAPQSKAPEPPNLWLPQLSQFASTGSIMIGYYMHGYAEGVLTAQARQRMELGLHPRSRESHNWRGAGTIFSVGGAISLGASCLWYEVQLRKQPHRKGFWYSHKPLPTIARNALWFTIAGVGAKWAANNGYRTAVRNP